MSVKTEAEFQTEKNPAPFTGCTSLPPKFDIGSGPIHIIIISLSCKIKNAFIQIDYRIKIIVCGFRRHIICADIINQLPVMQRISLNDLHIVFQQIDIIRIHSMPVGNIMLIDFFTDIVNPPIFAIDKRCCRTILEIIDIQIFN